MKIISLNTWGGRYFQELTDYVRRQSVNTDIFCFQEVFHTNSSIKQYKDIIRANLLDELKKILEDYQIFYHVELTRFDSNGDPVNFDLTLGKAIFIRKNINVDKSGCMFLYGNPFERFLEKDFSNAATTLQYLTFNTTDKQFMILNVHGTSFPGNKLDTDLRIEQSKKIKDFMNNNKGAMILTGDFNLLPETKSISILEEGMVNLISKYHIERTRSNLNPFFGTSSFQKFADYTFVANDIMVKDFQVPQVAISDHLPLILEFS